MKFEIITTNDRLAEVCQQASQQQAVMLDTEFVRTRTLFAQLGLIQLYDGELLSLIDPLKLTDMSPLWALMQNPDVVKVLHACGEDLEVFQSVAGCMPAPMLDTQIMAAFIGHGLSTGFGALVQEYLGVELEKGEARTNWLARPLSDKQLDYAAADVFYLLPLYQQLLAKVEAKGWMDALRQECETMLVKRSRVPDPEQVYTDIKNAWQLSPNQLAILQKLASWRLREARKRDLALNFVLKELHLWKIARYEITSKAVMAQEGFDEREIQRHGNRLISIVKDVEKMSQLDYPQPLFRLMEMPGYKQMVKRIKDEVNAVAKETGLATEFLASKKQINQLLSWAWKKGCPEDQLPEMLSGWRRALFAHRVLPLVQA
ncbi:ribonuclease D [Photobacterium sp. WH24]|uniref:Ribonuclease D n=1 Tax=Photobacterium arenosum TaxID=2774143 RepID=A0ABR9BIY3_9GAMM|nr:MULTISPECIES: ribonuclease D [Photobacterium]MBD8512427.1 ribonuclease D [Photobacterium arenosum]MBV7260787.1 ribonuclease D [Photobacterium sp. WH24]